MEPYYLEGRHLLQEFVDVGDAGGLVLEVPTVPVQHCLLNNSHNILQSDLK